MLPVILLNCTGRSVHNYNTGIFTKMCKCNAVLDMFNIMSLGDICSSMSLFVLYADKL